MRRLKNYIRCECIFFLANWCVHLVYKTYSPDPGIKHNEGKTKDTPQITMSFIITNIWYTHILTLELKTFLKQGQELRRQQRAFGYFRTSSPAIAYFRFTSATFGYFRRASAAFGYFRYGRPFSLTVLKLESFRSAFDVKQMLFM